MTLNEIVNCTQKDSDLQTVITAFKTSIHWEKVHRSQCLIFPIHYLVIRTFVTVQMYSLGLTPGTVCMTYKSLKSDNEPPFNSQEFRKIADNMGFIHFYAITVQLLICHQPKFCLEGKVIQNSRT
jgi:hypothetical protein